MCADIYMAGNMLKQLSELSLRGKLAAWLKPGLLTMKFYASSTEIFTGYLKMLIAATTLLVVFLKKFKKNMALKLLSA